MIIIPDHTQQPRPFPDLFGLGATTETEPSPFRLWSWLSLASMAASTYHGYKRNNSIAWAAAWGLLGAAFPIITPAIGVAQGFGKKK